MASESEECVYSGLFAADLHMGNFLPHAKPTDEGRTDRLDDQIELWKKFNLILKKYGTKQKWMDFHIIGDLFNVSRLDAVTAAETSKCLSECKAFVYLIPGNHDANNLQGGRFVTEMYKYGNNKVMCFEHSQVPFSPTNWLNFWHLEYSSLEKSRSILESYRESISANHKDKVNVLLFHNSVLGCQHYGWNCDIGLSVEEISTSFNHVIGGHFHKHQTFLNEGKRKGFYLGSPMHHRFDDVGRESCVWFLKFYEDGRLKRKKIKTGMPEFHLIHWNSYSGKMEFAEKDYVRFVVKATHAEWAKIKSGVIEHVKELKSKGIRAEYKHDPVYHHESRLEQTAGEASSSPERAIMDYVDSKGVNTDGLDTSKLKSIGLKALEQTRALSDDSEAA